MYLWVIVFLATANIVLVTMLWTELPRMIRRELKKFFEDEED